MHISRDLDSVLLDWKKQINRKPLMLRGARQVGKSTAVKELAKHFEYFIDINFEEQIEVKAFFEGNLDPKIICESLSVYFNTPIIPEKTDRKSVV